MNLLLTAPELDVYGQMALDECIVRARPHEVTLRFYSWTHGPAVTFGYAQFIREVRRTLQTGGYPGPCARRPTGGGMVFHGKDLTFSVVFPSQERPSEIYKNFHRQVFIELQRLGEKGRVFNASTPAAAYRPSVNHTASACFTNPVENDLLSESGHKILGGALRRFGNTVLYQGSLQVPQARENPAYKKAVIEGLRSYLAVDLRPQRAEKIWLDQAAALRQHQYIQPAWTEKF